eukprot:augustus_masked-scaffold_4-processed-gene-1.36-mRNA-1 protein AED:1.00 eAED:1.00 QI:0/0/0/0/1/1/2/0/279
MVKEFVQHGKVQLLEVDLDKTAALHSSLLKVGNEEDSIVVKSLNVDLRLETTDIIDFLTHSYPSNFGWNRTRKFMMLNLVSYERIWNSVVSEDDEHWIQDSLEALSYIHDFWFDPAKQVAAVGAVLHVENHFVFVAVHLSGRRGKHVIVYDSLAGDDRFKLLAFRIGQLWQRLLVHKLGSIDDGWSYSIKPFLEQQDGNNCGVFALVHSFQFMKSALFSGGVRKVGMPKVKQMREILFQWKPEPRFQPATILSIKQTVLLDETAFQEVHDASYVKLVDD